MVESLKRTETMMRSTREFSSGSIVVPAWGSRSKITPFCISGVSRRRKTTKIQVWMMRMRRKKSQTAAMKRRMVKRGESEEQSAKHTNSRWPKDQNQLKRDQANRTLRMKRLKSSSNAEPVAGDEAPKNSL